MAQSALMRTKQVAEYLGISLMTLWRWQRCTALNFPKPLNIETGKEKTNARAFFSKADIDVWLEERKNASRT